MTLTRGAGITGAVLCTVLALIITGWIVRDLRAVGEPLDLLRYWAGYADVRFGTLLPATSQSDVVLLVVCVLAAVAALRSPVAASALVVTGVVTLVFRLPGLWTIASSWMEGRYADELRTRALIGTFVALAAAVALIITGAAGRRPAGDQEPRTTRPGGGAAVTAFLVLGAAGAVVLAWEIRRLLTFHSSAYPDWFIGGRAVRVELIGVPPGWGSTALALLCLVVAFTALLRAVHARPLGMIVSGFLLASGLLGVTRFAHYQLLEQFTDVGLEVQLAMLTSFFLALAGAAGLAVLAVQGVQDTPDGRNQGHGPGYGPGYGQAPGGGYGYPPAPGYGYPPGGGAGPPPPSSPPPGW